MYVIALIGSPSRPSRTARLVERSQALLQQHGVDTITVSVYDFSPEDLLYGRFDSPSVRNLHALVAKASGLIVATPVYKAAYAGALKVLLDLLPEGALQGKPVLPLASGGTAAHMLALDYVLKPVLAALKARDIQHGVFAVEQQIATAADGTVQLAPELEQRLDEAARRFAASLKALNPRPLGKHALRDSLLAARVSV